MGWFYNSNSGMIGESPNWEMWPSLHSGTGWHGPFNSEADAEAYYNNNKAQNPGWKAPTKDTKQALKNEVSGDISGVGDLIGNFNAGGWFIRIGEILLGLILIGVGVAKLTGTTNLIASAVKAKIP